MKPTTICARAALAAALLAPAASRGDSSPYFSPVERRFMVEIAPASGLASLKAKDFAFTGAYKQEKLNGTMSAIPNLRLGLNIETEKMRYYISAGGGALWNGALVAPMACLDAAALFKMAGTELDFGIGPHIVGQYFFGPGWKGDADASLSGGFGAGGGLAMTFGKPMGNWDIKVSVDYVHAGLKASDSATWKATDGTLDLSGIAAQIGFVFRFDNADLTP